VSAHSYSNFLTSLPHSKYTTGPQRIFSKQRKRFDQTFINEEEDQPLDPRRTNMNMASNGGLGYQNGFYVQSRIPQIQKEVVLKP
jgi:hypothetical protein